MKRSLQSRNAFSLVEITLALGVAGFCLLAIFGLLPVGLNSNQTSIEQTAANGILSAVGSDLKATPTTSPIRGKATSSIQYGIAIPDSPVVTSPAPSIIYFTSDGQKVASASNARYRVTTTFMPNGAGRMASFVTVKVSWPAVAATPIGSVQTFLALDRN